MLPKYEEPAKFWSLNNDGLRSACAKAGLIKSGNRKTMVKRLTDYGNEQEGKRKAELDFDDQAGEGPSPKKKKETNAPKVHHDNKLDAKRKVRLDDQADEGPSSKKQKTDAPETHDEDSADSESISDDDQADTKSQDLSGQEEMSEGSTGETSSDEDASTTVSPDNGDETSTRDATPLPAEATEPATGDEPGTEKPQNQEKTTEQAPRTPDGSITLEEWVRGVKSRAPPDTADMGKFVLREWVDAFVKTGHALKYPDAKPMEEEPWSDAELRALQIPEVRKWWDDEKLRLEREEAAARKHLDAVRNMLLALVQD